MTRLWHDRAVSGRGTSGWVPGVAAALVGACLALLALPGSGPLLVAVVALQTLLVPGLLELLGAPSRAGTLVLAAVAAAGADVLAVRDGRVGALAGVVGLSVVAALLHQLVRRDGRSRVTESLAADLLAVVLVVAAACLVALRGEDHGRALVVMAAAAAGAGLLVGRLVDRAAPGPSLVGPAGPAGPAGPDGSARGLPGLLLTLLVAAGAAVWLGRAVADIAAPRAAAFGLAVAGAVAVGDLLVARAVTEAGSRSTSHARLHPRVLQHVGALLPYAVLAPVALVGGRLVA